MISVISESAAPVAPGVAVNDPDPATAAGVDAGAGVGGSQAAVPVPPPASMPEAPQIGHNVGSQAPISIR